MITKEIILPIILLIQGLNSFYYIWEILKGRVSPQRMGWFIFTVLSAIYFATGLQLSSGPELYFLGFQFIQILITFLISLKYGKGGYSKIDFICLGIAVIGIILWQITANPFTALFFAFSSDLIAIYLVAKAAIAKPEEENLWPWAVTSLTTVAVVAISGGSDPKGLLSTVYIGLAGLIVVVCTLIGHKIKQNAQALP